MMIAMTAYVLMKTCAGRRGAMDTDCVPAGEDVNEWAVSRHMTPCVRPIINPAARARIRLNLITGTARIPQPGIVRRAMTEIRARMTSATAWEAVLTNPMWTVAMTEMFARTMTYASKVAAVDRFQRAMMTMSVRMTTASEESDVFLSTTRHPVMTLTPAL
jgi:hypothetical protein